MSLFKYQTPQHVVVDLINPENGEKLGQSLTLLGLHTDKAKALLANSGNDDRLTRISDAEFYGELLVSWDGFGNKVDQAQLKAALAEEEAEAMRIQIRDALTEHMQLLKKRKKV